MNKRIWVALRLKKEEIEHELHKMEWHFARWTRNASGRIEIVEWKELRRKDWTELLRKSTTTESSCWGLMEKNLKTWWNYTITKCLKSWEERRKCKTPLQKNTENYLHFKTWEEKILEIHQQNLDELLKNELNHEEPPWRTSVTKKMMR